MNYKEELAKLEAEEAIQEELRKIAEKPYRHALLELNKEKNKLEDKLLKELGVFDDAWVSRDWTCEESPIGWCIMTYDKDDSIPIYDREDYCMFCKMTEDRH